MNRDQVEVLHGICQTCDPRIPDFDDQGVGLDVWSAILAEVPQDDALDVVHRIYSRPQMLVLQPGHIVQAWEDLYAEQVDLLDELRGIDARLLNGDLPADFLATQAERRKKVSGALTGHYRAVYEHSPDEVPRMIEAATPADPGDLFDRRNHV